MRSSRTRPVCRPGLEKLEDRLAPNNMLALLDAPSDWLGLGVTDLFQDDAPSAALRATADQLAPSVAAGPLDVPPPATSSFGGAATLTPVHGPAESAARLEVLAGLEDPLADQGAGTRSDPRVFPPNSHPYGRSYAQWSAAWLQWSMGIPTATSPLTDTTGQFAGVGQAGQVFYLAGTWGNLGPITRTVSVAQGKALFFPIVNAFFFIGPGENFTVPEMRAVLRPFIDGAVNLQLTVDGTAVPDLSRFRVESPVFTLTLPADNFFAPDVPAGSYQPTVVDGIHVMLTPLERGTHSIRIQGELPGFGLTMDVTYQLTVG